MENFFSVGGGTIDLQVTGTAKNSKRVVINEIMWAVDDRLIGQPGQYDQQWIEIYNPTSIPVEINTPTHSFLQIIHQDLILHLKLQMEPLTD